MAPPAGSVGGHHRERTPLSAYWERWDGTLDPDQGARLLGLLAEAADRFGATSTVPLVPTPFFGTRAARRFAWLDSRRAADEGGRQHWLFAEAQQADELAYSRGFALALPVGEDERALPGRAEAEALRTLRAGAFTPRDHAGVHPNSARSILPRPVTNGQAP